MKKQLLFTIFILFISGLTTVYGQAVPYTAPRPLVGCDDDFTNPIAGKSYTYSATATPENGNFTFWATQDPNFITTSGGTTSFNNVAPTLLTVAANQLMATSTNYNTATQTNNVNITWSSGLFANVNATNPLFVAVHYAAPTGECSDNFKVYRIIPKNGFTVDIVNLDPATYLPATSNPYDYEPEQCTDLVRGAQWTTGGMQYDYGTNYLYFEFVAANFTEHWVPTFSLSGLNGAQAETYEYTYSTPDTWGTTPPTWSTLVSGTTEINTTENSTENGVSVFVRVRIDNTTFENLAGQTLTMTLDGQNAEGLWDVVNATCVDPQDPDQNDTANQVINPRPTVLPVAPGVFE